MLSCRVTSKTFSKFLFFHQFICLDNKKSTKRKRNLISALPTRKEKNLTKEEAKFSDFLAQPSLFQNVPVDFYDNWACIVAPNGIRCSIATKGKLHTIFSFLPSLFRLLFLENCYYYFWKIQSTDVELSFLSVSRLIIFSFFISIIVLEKIHESNDIELSFLCFCFYTYNF